MNVGLKIIGAGFGRTGTLSLKNALEQLGFDKCYHMMEVRQSPGHAKLWSDVMNSPNPPWDELFTGYQAAVDWPASRYWRELADYYPDAKVILTVRDPDAWHKSVMNTIYPMSANIDSADPRAVQGKAWVDQLIWDGVFGGQVEDRDAAVAVYEANSAAVRAAIPAERLLTYSPGDGWEPLCQFLDVPVPATDYPRVNSTEDFLARTRS